jgi:hypothetical protein
MRVLFDTEEYVTTLKEGGVPDDQAHAMGRGLHHAFHQGVATSEDITMLGARMTVLEGKIDSVAAIQGAKTDNVAATLSAKIDGVEKSLNDKIDNAVTMLKERMQMQMYILLAVIAVTSHLGYHILQVIGLVH